MSGAPTIESNGIELKAKLNPDFASVVSPEALELVAKLHRAFEPRRQELLKKRVELAKKLDAGQKLDFLPETKSIRDGAWKIAPVPKALETRRVELTGPVDAKMVINALNSGADSYMADFEDSNSPYWENIIQGQVNLKKAIRRDIELNLFGKEYKLNEKTATLIVRPRGWHLDEKHVLVDGQRVSGGIFDFAIFENTFLDSFLELAFVEVSTDSQSWARFPNESLSQHKTQTGSFGFTQPTKIHNLAGKYRHPYGTPFDLQDVAMMSNIRINEIRYVRIIDVVGSIDTLYAQRDSKNRIINDPWPTPFPSSGFDLDAVGVIHQAEFNNINTSLTQNTIPFYFHSESRTIHLRSNSTKNPANSRIENNLKIFNAAGQLCFLAEFKPDQTNNYQIEIPKFLSAGTYIARYNNYSIKIILTDNR